MNPLNFISSYNRKHTNNVAEIYTRASNKSAYIPLYNQVASAGVATPMHIEARLSADDMLVKNPMATYFVRVKGDSMLNAGITDGDVVVVDRSLEPSIGHIVLAEVDGEFTVKYLGQQKLLPANTNCQAFNFADARRIAIVGVVTGAMRRFVY
jgi:DNA polymerase V